MQLSEDEPDYLDKQKKLQEKKELKPVDHSQIQYQAFKKCFYREIPELSKLTPKQVDKIRHDMGDIKVRGKDVPNPILNWYQSGLNDKILTVLIDKKKFEKPFPIQA